MSASTPRPVGLLLAAGQGRRMGTTKQLLPWPPPDGASTVVATSFDLLARVCPTVYVVLDHDADRIAAALRPRAFVTVRGDGASEQLVSLRTGLEAIRADGHAEPTLLHLADHPGVRAETIDLLLAAAADAPDRVVAPEFAGRGGHPTVLPAAVATTIVAAPLEKGLRGYLRAHPERVRRVPVDDPGVRRDLDRPCDYRVGGPDR